MAAHGEVPTIGEQLGRAAYWFLGLYPPPPQFCKFLDLMELREMCPQILLPKGVTGKFLCRKDLWLKNGYVRGDLRPITIRAAGMETSGGLSKTSSQTGRASARRGRGGVRRQAPTRIPLPTGFRVGRGVLAGQGESGWLAKLS